MPALTLHFSLPGIGHGKCQPRCVQMLRRVDRVLWRRGSASERPRSAMPRNISRCACASIPKPVVRFTETDFIALPIASLHMKRVVSASPRDLYNPSLNCVLSSSQTVTTLPSRQSYSRSVNARLSLPPDSATRPLFGVGVAPASFTITFPTPPPPQPALSLLRFYSVSPTDTSLIPQEIALRTRHVATETRRRPIRRMAAGASAVLHSPARPSRSALFWNRGI